MARIGYARVSTVHQDEASQIKTLKEAGCELIFHEKISTRTADHKREQLQAALSQLAEGDVLVVSKLDRLGRTQVEVINRLDQQAETAHKKAVEALLSRFPLAETDDVGRALVGKVRRAVRSQSAE